MDEKKSTQKVAAVYSVTQTNQKNLKKNKTGLRTTCVVLHKMPQSNFNQNSNTNVVLPSQERIHGSVHEVSKNATQLAMLTCYGKLLCIGYL